MSSLSEEEVDAGWDDAVATAQAVVPSNAESVPPNSITVEVSEKRLQSLVVPAGSQVSSTPPEAKLTPSSTGELGGSALRVWATAHRYTIWLAATLLGFLLGFFGFRTNH